MYINEKLKLNKFAHVHIKSNKEYFSMLGTVTPMNNKFTGDETATMSMNKTEELYNTEKKIKYEMTNKE